LLDQRASNTANYPIKEETCGSKSSKPLIAWQKSEFE
jgi:hypothetical protein